MIELALCLRVVWGHPGAKKLHCQMTYIYKNIYIEGVPAERLGGLATARPIKRCSDEVDGMSWQAAISTLSVIFGMATPISFGKMFLYLYVYMAKRDKYTTWHVISECCMKIALERCIFVIPKTYNFSNFYTAAIKIII